MTEKITPIQPPHFSQVKPQSEESDKKEYKKIKAEHQTEEEKENGETRPHHGLFDEYT